MPSPRFPDTQLGQAPEHFAVTDWGGVNVQSPRSAIGDPEFSWLENFIPIAPGNLRTLWAEGAALYTAPGGLTIIYTLAFNLSQSAFFAVFLSDGTAVQVNATTGATTTISSFVNDFYAGGALPSAVQYNAQGIIIVCESQNPNGYFAWDGVTLYRPGQAAPNWLTNSTPTAMPSGIHGSAVEIYSSYVWVTAPPSGTVPTIISNSAPGNGANFSGTAGGGTVPQNDSSLRSTYTALKQANGFLYAFGDSSVRVISNAQTSGSPLATTYSNQSLDPQVGTNWPGTVQQFSQGIVYANTQGVFLVAGGTVKKISHALDGLFANLLSAANATLNAPTAAVVTIFGIRVYLLLITAPDQKGVIRNFMLCWHGAANKWFAASQITALNVIFPQEVNSVLAAWGNSGTSIFQMFQTPSATLPKSLQSKFWPGAGGDGWAVYKKAYRFYFQAFDNAGSGILFQGTIDSDSANAALNAARLVAQNTSLQNLQAQNQLGQNIYPVVFGLIAATVGYFEFTNALGGIIHFQNSSNQTILWGVKALAINGVDVACYGRLLGITLGSTSVDFSLISYQLEFAYDAAFLG